LRLLPACYLEGLAEERLRLRGCIRVFVEENLGPQPVELGIVVVLSHAFSLRDAECERAQGLVVAPDLPEALGKKEEEPGRSGTGPDLGQLDHRLLDLREARLALSRLDPGEASAKPPQSQVERKPELLGENNDFF